MTKRLSILLLLVLPIVINAQKFDGGIIIGPVASQVDGDDLGGYNKVGGMFGGWVSRDFQNNWSGQFEIKFVQKGSRKPQNLDIGDYTEYHMKLNYIDFPLIANYTLHPDIKVRFGLIPAYMISHKEEDAIGEFESDITRPFKQVNLAGFVGVNYRYKEKISFEIRQAMDVMPFRPHPGGLYTWYDYGQYNRWLEFAVLFNFKNEN